VRTLPQLEHGMDVLERAAVLMSIPLCIFSGYVLAGVRAVPSTIGANGLAMLSYPRVSHGVSPFV
jgi:hypothetical protein